jgi:nucleoside-diphosphate-sugar epimerase
MINDQKTVFVTGSTGKMGLETVKQLLARGDRFRLKLLVFDSKRDRRIIAPYARKKNVEVLYGNLKDAALVEQCVQGCDFVLHIGAMVSPMADKYPEETMKVNLGSTLHIINAIKKQDNANQIGLVYIATVGMTGDRGDPIHWGRVGDPIKGSVFDYYSASKIAAERAVFESGLKKWVSLRQTGMMPFVSDPSPIMFHQNLNNPLEWVTAQESGLLMTNVCENWIPDSFWRHAYNIGGGSNWRLTLWQMYEMYFEHLGLDYKQVFDTRDFGLYNFHGQWFADSDRLNEIAKFRHLDPKQFFRNEMRKIRAVRSLPLLKHLIPNERRMKQMLDEASQEHGGTKWMFGHNKEDWITAFFGSPEERAQIPSWEDGFKLYDPSRTPTYLDHGYDEAKPTGKLDLSDIQNAAEFRGGVCISTCMKTGDLYTPLKWKCHFGHAFQATPNLILKAGHWCPECERTTWDFAEVAKHSPFFAQVWRPLHGDQHAVKVVKEYSDKTVQKMMDRQKPGSEQWVEGWLLA